MKKFTLFSHTKPLTLLNLLPSTVVAIIAIIFNGYVDTFPHLYPLIITALGITLFLAIFIFRILLVSTEELRMIGPFSSRDKALIKKDTMIKITLKRKNLVRIELFGENEGEPIFDWMKADERGDKICILRESVVGGTKAATRLLKFFDVSAATAEKLLSEDCSEISVGTLLLSSEILNEERAVSIRFTEIL